MHRIVKHIELYSSLMSDRAVSFGRNLEAPEDHAPGLKTIMRIQNFTLQYA